MSDVDYANIVPPNVETPPDDPFRQEVGEAWKQHIEGREDEAIDSFKAIIDQDAEHVDANYGIALAYEAKGQDEQAIAYYQRARSLVESLAESEPSRATIIRRETALKLEKLGAEIDIAEISEIEEIERMEEAYEETHRAASQSDESSD